MSMPLRTNVQEAVRSLSSSMQRSLLALIGIVIGIGSVIAMITAGMIVKDEALRQFRELGTNILTIRNVSTDPGPGRHEPAALRFEDALGLSALPALEASAPHMTFRRDVFLPAQHTMRASFVGMTTAFNDLYQLRVAKGRLLSDLDHRQRYCVIGPEVAAAMQSGSTDSAVGRTLRSEDAVYTIVGVLQDGLHAPKEIQMDGAVLVPARAAQRVYGTEEVRGITVRTRKDVHYLAASAQIREYFQRKSEYLAVKIDSPVRLIEQMNKQMRMFALLLGAVGGISLIVGGIGIMNVMLASVNERRTEIGLRRALGARRRDIQNQFLIESVILSRLGGIIGAMLGIGTTYVICRFAEWAFIVSGNAVSLGVGIACTIGLFFGL